MLHCRRRWYLVSSEEALCKSEPYDTGIRPFSLFWYNDAHARLCGRGEPNAKARSFPISDSFTEKTLLKKGNTEKVWYRWKLDACESISENSPNWYKANNQRFSKWSNIQMRSWHTERFVSIIVRWDATPISEKEGMRRTANLLITDVVARKLQTY